MTSTTFFFIFIPILAVLLLAINLLLAPHNPYQEKDSAFECGFHSFLGQNRTQFNISFFIFGLLFLLFDLEIVLIYPYSVSGYTNDIYGLSVMMVFFVLLTLGFVFELGKNALTIDSRQTASYSNVNTDKPVAHISKKPVAHIPEKPVAHIPEKPLILQSSIIDPSVLTDIVDALGKVVDAIPSAQAVYDTAKDIATNPNDIPKVIDQVISDHNDKVEAAYDVVKNTNTAGLDPSDVEACKNSSETLYEEGKRYLEESSETAKEIYEDRK